MLVKANDTESVYIAAASRELAEKLRQSLPQPGFSVVATSELTASAYRDFNQHRVVVFETQEQLNEFTRDRGSYPYERVAIRYSEKLDG